MSPRDELIRIQRRIVRGLKREVFGTLYGDSGDLRRYAVRYARSFRQPRRVISRDTLMRRLVPADLVFHGDVHTLKLAQLSPIKILRELRRRGRRVCLGLEMFCARDQATLDAFQAGRISERTLLERIRYDRTWGFEWRSYRNLVLAAVDEGIPLLALDCRLASRRVPLDVRDRFAAERIASRRRAHPDELLYVFFGELHLAPGHLPAAVARALGSDRARQVILHQSTESVYWNLASRGRELDAGIVELSRSRFCMLAATPLVLYHSFRNWLDRQDAVASTDEASREEEGNGPLLDRADQVHGLVRIIVDSLGIRVPDIDGFTVYTSADPDLFDVLRFRWRIRGKRLRRLTRELRAAKSLFIPEGNVIFLPTLSLNRGAEEAARFVHFRLAGYGGPPASPRDRFYTDVMHEALGFFGSKLVNPKRRAKTVAYYREQARLRRSPDLAPLAARFLEVSRLVVRHEDGGRSRSSRRVNAGPAANSRLFRLPPELHAGVTGALGHLLGERIFEALRQGRCRIEEVQRLFAIPFDRGTTGREAYFLLRSRLDRGVSRPLDLREHRSA